jgi:hypothetical protein
MSDCSSCKRRHAGAVLSFCWYSAWPRLIPVADEAAHGGPACRIEGRRVGWAHRLSCLTGAGLAHGSAHQRKAAVMRWIEASTEQANCDSLGGPGSFAERGEDCLDADRSIARSIASTGWRITADSVPGGALQLFQTPRMSARRQAIRFAATLHRRVSRYHGCVRRCGKAYAHAPVFLFRNTRRTGKNDRRLE